MCHTSTNLILNRYDNICYRICFLLLPVGEDSLALSLPVAVRDYVCPVVREYVCPVVPCSSNLSRTRVSSRDSGWFWLFLPVCKFNHLDLDHDSILPLGSSQAPQQSA